MARSTPHRRRIEYIVGRTARALVAMFLLLAIGLACSGREARPPKPVEVSKPSNSDSKLTRTAWHERPGRGNWIEPQAYTTDEPGPGRFALAAGGRLPSLVVSDRDHPGVCRAARDLQADLQRVTGGQPELRDANAPSARSAVLIGTIGQSPIVDQLVATGKLDVTGVVGRWETFLVTVIEHPLPNLDQALAIVGSDPRATIYGIYDLSAQIGISPWYYWDDVPPRQRREIYVLPGRHTLGEPAVKYRGLFINDENPALGNWVPRTFGPGKAPNQPGGFNHSFYAKVFELMLRLKANYLWPAVWGRAFAEDDPENQATADQYAIVMGTSHEAPMNRGIEEWNRHAKAAQRDSAGNIVKPGQDPYGGSGEWSFRRNPEAVKAYWRDGIRRIGSSEVIVTLGMRGNGDTALEDGAGIELMQSILRTERQILADVTKKDVTTIPQVWTLYKEVQNYWQQGLRAPNDVTVVWCDDNWGNLRKLPDPSQPKHPGGYGLYYHFDYVGGSRNYKWVDTNLLPNIWEQLHLAYRYGVEQLWMVNVGDLKNMELPIEFFMDYAWSPERWPVTRLPEWERRWAERQFGPDQAEAIADVLHRYARLQSRRKPELLNRRFGLEPSPDRAKDPGKDPGKDPVVDDVASPFSLTNYRELELVVGEWQALREQAERIATRLPARYQATYFQLVLYEVKASALLYQLRFAEFKNLLYFDQGRAATNQQASLAEQCFEQSKQLAAYYNHELSLGKWNGFQTQAYVGYGDVQRYGSDAVWQQPERDNVALEDAIYPPVKRYFPAKGQQMGVAIDGSAAVWSKPSATATLPHFSPYQRQPSQYIEVFSRGTDAFDFTIAPSVPWIRVVPDRGRLNAGTPEVRAEVTVDFSRAAKGTTRVPMVIAGPHANRIVVEAIVDNPDGVPANFEGFIESNGTVSIEADHFQRSVESAAIRWQRLADIGRTGAGMTPIPVTASTQTPGKDGPRLEYDLYLFAAGVVEVWAYLSPRNNVLGGDGIRYASSIDDEEPQIVNVTKATGAEPMNRAWERNTADNVTRTVTRHRLERPGRHVLKYWMVDPTVIVQKLVVDTGGVRPSYLGPPESYRGGTATRQ